MKKFNLSLIVIILSIYNLFAKEISTLDSTHYCQKYDKMAKIGTGLTIYGTLIGCIGATILIMGAEENAKDTSSYFLSMPGLGKCIAGTIIMSTGGVILCTGIPLLITGKIKSKNFKAAFFANGVKLTCDF